MLNKLFPGLAVAVMLAASYAPDGVAAEMVYAPQTSNEREIKVTITPQNLSSEASAWDFEVTLETHTQALNDDLVRSSVLIVDGKQYSALGWEGAPPGGHHRKGLLHFKAIIPQPRSPELQLRLANDPSPRRFKWLLK